MSIFCIMVTYNPVFSKLKTAAESITAQVDGIIIVKNSAEELPSELQSNSKITVVQLDTNRGIAYAQNRGIEKAAEFSAAWILFSDQDTVYPHDYITRMTESAAESRTENCVLTPLFFNTVKNRVEPVSLGMSKICMPKSDVLFYEVFHAISSGTLCRMDTVLKVGFFNEKLFIDYVDFEWCWRARRSGIKIISFPHMIVTHTLGDYQTAVLWRKCTMRSPFRYYHMLRNGIYLGLYSPYLSSAEKILLVKKVVIHCAGIFLRKPGGAAVSLIVSALFEGISKRMKPYCVREVESV